jgi:hypothetical protein
LWGQLKDGAKLKASGIVSRAKRMCLPVWPTGLAYRLERWRDFDDVILGASIGSLPYMTRDLARASPRWQAMLDHVPTVATQAAQFWVTKTPEDLGWTALVGAQNAGDQDDQQTVITGFAEPLDTWADMSDLLPREDWPDDGPTAIAYFCSPAHDVDVDPRPLPERVRDWADRDLTRLWPKARKGGKFDASILYAVGATTPAEKFAGQYFRQNLYGSERYVLSAPNSVQSAAAGWIGVSEPLSGGRLDALRDQRGLSGGRDHIGVGGGTRVDRRGDQGGG